MSKHHGFTRRRHHGRSRAGFVRPALTLAALAGMSPGIAGQDGVPLPDDAGVEVLATPDSLFFVKGRDYGTDAYGGPFDVILNKGFAVAQWQDQDRHIFSYPYGWRAVWASITDPGPAMERARDWGKVFRSHVLPLGWDEFRDAQWMPPLLRAPLRGRHGVPEAARVESGQRRPVPDAVG